MLQGVNESDLNKVINLINRLMAINFLTKELDREGYILLRRYREPINQFFGTLGWEYVFDDRHECVFVSSPENSHRRNLTKDDSIWLFILRLIYQEKRQSLSLSEFPITTTYEIRTKYDTFRLPFVTKTKLADLVRIGKQYHLLEPLDGDVASDECRFRLFHTFIHLVQIEALDQIQELIARYGTSQQEDEEEFNEVAETT